MIELPAGTILGPYETRAEWLEARREGLGGSDIGAILGMSTFTSALEVFYSKDVETTPDDKPSEQMEIGQDIESWILHHWFQRSDEPVGTHLEDDLILIQSRQRPYLLHSPDALLVEIGTGMVRAGVEIKNIRSDHNWDPIPEFYMAQVQHGLLCSGLSRWIVVALVAGQKIITREIEPDLEMQGRIATEGERFWLEHVLANVPPAPDGSESASRALRGRWEVSQDEIVEIPDYLYEGLKLAKANLDEAETDYAMECQIIQAAMGEREHARLPDGTRVATWKTSTRTSVDVKRLRAEAPELAKKYEKSSSTRTFRPSL